MYKYTRKLTYGTETVPVATTGAGEGLGVTVYEAYADGLNVTPGLVEYKKLTAPPTPGDAV